LYGKLTPHFEDHMDRGGTGLDVLVDAAAQADHMFVVVPDYWWPSALLGQIMLRGKHYGE
jgi:hypothetical protein